MNNEKDILNNLPPFHVGQKVVAIEDHSQLHYKKGDVYTVTGLAKTPCCGNWIIDIGVRTHHSLMDCFCGDIYKNNYMFSIIKFRPLQSQSFPLITLTKVIEEQHELVSSN